MGDTREKILLTALHLFARDGYEAVSVSDIAGALSMTKGALYRHYASKRAIFDSIVERMYAIDAARSRQYAVPAETFEASKAAYDTVSPDSVRNFTVAQFDFWTGDAFAADFRRMLTLEQYRSEEMTALYSSCLTAGPVAYTEDIFRGMMKNGVLRSGDPALLAVEFFAPLLLLMVMTDGGMERNTCRQLLCDHIERFMQHNLTDGKEE